MPQLQENPNGCPNFEPNLFRRERCKHCGRSWQLHAGAISESALLGFVQQQQQTSHASAKAEAKAKAKAQARRRELRAVEDSWLFDMTGAASAAARSDGEGSTETNESGSFRMVTGREWMEGQAQAVVPAAQSSSRSRPLVVNLVNFAECNVASSEGSSPPSSSRAMQVAASADEAPARPTASAPAAVPPRPQSFHGEAVEAAAAAGARSTAMSRVRSGGSAQGMQQMLRPQPLSQQGQFSMPMHSKDDVLLEEIQYLRQMLADANEEKRIRIAIIRDELAEKQRAIETLMMSREAPMNQQQGRASPLEKPGADGAQATGREATDRAPIEHVLDLERLQLQQARQDVERERQELEQQRASMERQEEDTRRTRRAQEERESDLRRRVSMLEAKFKEVKLERDGYINAARERTVALAEVRRQVSSMEADLRKQRARLAWWEAHDDALTAVTTENEVVDWERKHQVATQATLSKLMDRRVELRVAAVASAAQDSVLCKICYDRPSACALMPCRHHAFCKPCAVRLTHDADPMCPLCRTAVTGVFETFSG